MSLTKRNQEKRKDRKKLRKIKKQVQGITLIALVVTIIVLLILAGVAINLTVGDNGLFKRAQNAADTWQMAEQNEQKEIEQAGDFLEIYSQGVNTASKVSEAITQNKFYLENTKIKDDLDNEVVIPAYFKLASDSAVLVEDGIVIEDKDGNQFVWIPAKTGAGATIHTNSGDKTIAYQRKNFGKQSGNYSEYTETMPIDEEASVNEWGGYYIGRYEAGDGSSTDFRSSATDGTVVIKKNQVPYNWITQADTITKSKGMAGEQNYGNAFTKLVSSYAWDTALDFIQKANSNNDYSDYATSSPEGNYSNTDYGDGLIRTGQTEAVSNIYDMGGNLWEYTTGSNSGENGIYVIRGGYCGNDYDNCPAGYRGSDYGVAYSNEGFRVTLYCNTES